MSFNPIGPGDTKMMTSTLKGCARCAAKLVEITLFNVPPRCNMFNCAARRKRVLTCLFPARLVARTFAGLLPAGVGRVALCTRVVLACVLAWLLVWRWAVQ
eukprot:5224267-Amphidinium_carterae.1